MFGLEQLTSGLFLASLVFAVAAILFTVLSNSRKLPLPPGPPPLPFIGNALQLPKSRGWTRFAEWGRIYGPVVYFSVFGRELVILNNAETVFDLMDKRSNIYSDRPMAWMFQKLAGMELAVFNISSEHDRFKTYRKLMHGGLNQRAIVTYHNIMQDYACQFIEGLESTPERFVHHIRKNFVSVILKVAYGYSVTGDNDHFVIAAEEATAVVALAANPGRWLVDFFPILRFVPAWFPGADFKRQGAHFRRVLESFNDLPHDWVKEQIAAGTHDEQSFSAQLLIPPANSPPLTEDEDDIVKWSVAGLYAGGADTTTSAMKTFFLAMALNPSIQRRAQAEVDEITGSTRLLTPDDIPALPFVDAILKECVRWAPVAELGLPHRVTRDDEYRGFRVPRGAMVLANIWALLHDEDFYPDSEVFDPDRFMAAPGRTPQQDPTKYAFGFGRRICPGEYFARAALALSIAHVLARFDIADARDAAGRLIGPEVALDPGILCHSLPFSCSITPRSRKAL
ncbi:cytochrome P450 [Rickenella mellea]|uniref:Cytochrome P450 n=1 Tax=Rickenella mellea TaxID=50990 RepID=A0A4Y7QEE5_9AGAM|nr:cytochrome P450 [Rickenella mellea]